VVCRHRPRPRSPAAIAQLIDPQGQAHDLIAQFGVLSAQPLKSREARTGTVELARPVRLAVQHGQPPEKQRTNGLEARITPSQAPKRLPQSQAA